MPGDTTDRTDSDRSQRSDSTSVVPSKTTAVFLCEPLALIRHAMRDLIERIPGCIISGEASSFEEAWERIEAAPPDIIMTELVLAGASGLEFVLRAKKSLPKTKVVVLAVPAQESLLNHALRSGASAVISKAAPISEFSKTLERIISTDGAVTLDGMPLASRIVTSSIGSNSVEAMPNDPLSALSPREREIFHFLASGLQNSTIAQKLFISPRTVETHRARIVRKLQINSNGELIRFAIRHGLSVV